MASTSYLFSASSSASTQPGAVVVVPFTEQALLSPRSFSPSFRAGSAPTYTERDPLAPEVRRGSLQNAWPTSAHALLQVPFTPRRLSMPLLSHATTATTTPSHASLPTPLPSNNATIAAFRRISVVVEQITDKSTLPPMYSPDDKQAPAPPYEKVNRHPETLSRYMFKLGFCEYPSRRLCTLLYFMRSRLADLYRSYLTPQYVRYYGSSPL